MVLERYDYISLYSLLEIFISNLGCIPEHGRSRHMYVGKENSEYVLTGTLSKEAAKDLYERALLQRICTR